MAKTPAVGKKAAKTPKKASSGGKKGKKRVESYSSYIYKVLKQVHPNTGISKRGMSMRYPLGYYRATETKTLYRLSSRW